ncbi:ABC transporter ATP-binding protein [Aquibacillus salsiterrae]|uniref:Energy-coupling factor ABC transporter ATP-binding protein n=1 Tax=Aquibacillus salsiterrae TaxID=2950439 RepID=A0A9X3WGL8_9BACI|nr:ABC transporter ATP-binding protein [Aquibacillus salsiterrae]MDC3418056.1 energy-coupling factor ABC transporter ATP-binding protein [Aquibacillus salsiterrae]
MKEITGVEDLRLKFPGTDSLLLKDFSISIKKGEKVLLLGPSGSGKSTLLQVLTGLIPNSVEVPMKAKRVNIPKSWGFLFQDPDTQFCMPYVDEEIAFVLENLAIARDEMRHYITDYLKQVGLQFEDIHTPIQSLSGGMKQRLAIASVLALEADVLFLDEPTAMLDPTGTLEVWETVKKIGENKTLVIVEHKIEQVIDFIDRIILLNDDGVIVADGTKKEIFSDYKHVLVEQGIWYPGVWEDYLRNRSSPNETNAKKPIVTLKEFDVYRGKEKKVHIKDLTVNQGEWITVLGENGAGKSTWLLGLMNLLKTKGCYQIDNQDARRLSKLTDYFAFVFQNPEFQFVTNSVFDEIAYTLRLQNWSEDQIVRKVETLLARFHLQPYAKQHPYHLSMGQKRRLSVAAATVMEQPVLLLDEPTFGQDARNTFAILEQLQQMRNKGTTIIMITHDCHIVKHFATRVLYINDGRLTLDCLPLQYMEEKQQSLEV